MINTVHPLFLSALFAIAAVSLSAADDAELRKRGEQIYRAQCLECHGQKGVGVKDHYADPLIGDASLGELTKLIAETMPEEDSDACVGEDAAAVAAYIHHSFYSEAARVRNRPPRIRLARLTGQQLRKSIADLYGAFQDAPWVEKKTGVEGLYFTGAKYDKKKQKIKRIDPVLDFDFGDKGPGSGIDAKEFYIHWSGSVLPERTGRHEFIVRSTCAFKMDFARDQREWINNHVQSEGRTEFRKTVFLTAGRAYFFKVDLFQRKRKTEQPPASFSFSWVPPGGVEEIIPQRNLLATWQPATIAVQSKLPADDRSYGYERGTSVNRQWDDSTTRTALEFAEYAGSELWSDYKRRHRKDKDEDRAKLRSFLNEVAAVAFRGPLSEAQQNVYINRQVDETPDDVQAIQQVCLILLKSPRFLYPTLDLDRSFAQQAANRLTLTLYDSLPSDRWLREKVRKNQIKNVKQIEDTAWRMMDDYRVRAKFREFLHEWLELADSDDFSKDAKRYPGFDRRIVADLHTSMNKFIDSIVWTEESDYRQLIQADWAFTNPRLAKFYGKSWQAADPKQKGFTRSVADPQSRVGVLTHPLMMAHLSYHANTSPIHRGVFLYRNVLGRVLRPPNAAFSPLNPDLHPKLTTRERVEMQTGEVNCQVCHSKINALGFTLENLDPVGRFRAKENEKTVNAAGSYTDRNGKTHHFRGPRELANFLVNSQDSHRAFVDSCFEYFVKQPVNAYGPDKLDELTRGFRESGFKIRNLLVAIATTAASPPDTP